MNVVQQLTRDIECATDFQAFVSVAGPFKGFIDIHSPSGEFVTCIHFEEVDRFIQQNAGDWVDL